MKQFNEQPFNRIQLRTILYLSEAENFNHFSFLKRDEDENCHFIGKFFDSSIRQYVRMDSLIFAEPCFIRKNILLNCLYSNFKTEEFSSTIETPNFSDVLRATYHNLMPVNSLIERRHTLTLLYHVLSVHSEFCTDLDWYYLERILVHQYNLTKNRSEHINQLLARYGIKNGPFFS